MRPGLVAEQVGPGPDHRDQRHHQLLADRIDRRVGDLGEVLLEVVVEQLGPGREHGDRRVRAHRADRVVGGLGHGRQEALEVLLGVAEGLLAIEQGGRVVAGRCRTLAQQVGQVLELELGLAQPFRVRSGVGQVALDLLVLDDAALLEVNEQHFAGLQAPLADDLLIRDRQHPDLGGHDHQLVGHDEARRAQAIAVQGRADLAAVGEGDGGRPVPRLHQGGEVFVEGLALGIHQRIAGPGLRDQHHHRLGQRIAARQQQLQRIVEAGRVGLAVRDQRPHLVEVGPQQRRLHGPPPRRHPVDVAAHRIDLAVVGDEPVGVGEPPGREGVGREPLVHQGERRHRQGVLQVEIELPDLMGQDKALVDHRPRRERRHVELGQARQAVLGGQVRQRVLGLLADGQQLALEGVLVGHVRAPAHDGLADHGHLVEHGLAQARRVDRHVAPADQLLVFGPHEVLELADGDLAGLLVLRQEAHRHRIVAGRRKGQAVVARPGAQQGVGDLDQYARAVAQQGVGPHRAPVVEVDQDLQALGDDVVGLRALDVGDEADAAGVVLMPRVIQTLFRRRSHTGRFLNCLTPSFVQACGRGIESPGVFNHRTRLGKRAKRYRLSAGTLSRFSWR